MARKYSDAYTYRCGQRVALNKQPDQFVVRLKPDELPESMAISQQVSGNSTRVGCAAKELESMMSEARELAPTHHAYQIAEDDSDFLITDRVIVTFHEPPTITDLGEFLGRNALQVVTKYSEKEFLLRLTDHTGMNPVKLIVQLNENEPLIEVADHDLNMIMSTAAISLPSDPEYTRQWHLHRHATSGADYDARSSSRCEEAWQLLDGFGDSQVVVGVTDDGCQLDHPDFNSGAKFAGWGYFAGNTLFRTGDPGASPGSMYQAGSNHGTSCAGVISAEVDSEMTVGAAPGAKLLPIKWESSGSGLFISDSKLMTALDYLGPRVDVISNSWGSSPSSNWSSAALNRIQELAKTGGRRGKGIVFLWAAGNENCPISHSSTKDIPYDNGWNQAGTAWIGVKTSRVFSHNLVGIPGVVHVAALTSAARRSHYSNYGTGIGLCAPSNNVHKYWRLNLPGRGIVTTMGMSTVTNSFGGTSSATPFVAGIAALVISANPQLSGYEVISILQQTASKDLNFTDWPKTPPANYDPSPTWDVSPASPFQSGAFQQTGSPDGTWSPWFGHGRVDAFAAVQRARQQAGSSSSRVSATAGTEFSIPDNNPVGIVSRMSVQDDGVISNLAVSVDIEHTYIGDLEVRLIAPDGRRIDLHKRAGSNTRNLVRSWDATQVTSLGTLAGLPIRGVWGLEVVDLASADSGKLRQWRIDAEVTRSATIRKEVSALAAIPDSQPAGVSSTLVFNEQQSIADIAVELDITHSYIGDLRVKLKGPDGTEAILHERAGQGSDNIQRTYSASDTPSLAVLVGKPLNGTWTLNVADLASQDIGKLNRWAMSVR